LVKFEEDQIGKFKFLEIRHGIAHPNAINVNPERLHIFVLYDNINQLFSAVLF